MKNDNASIQVINMTEAATTAYVRFYFRPLTPTQYYNEGFKHSLLRYDGDVNANVPVPVFFLFDLETLLNMPETCFSGISMAGHGTKISKGIEEFAALNFSGIYSIGAASRDTQKCRHAEIMYPTAFKIDNALRFVLCRNEIEKSTLLNILRKNSAEAYEKYKPMIRVCRENVFEKNGLFVNEISYGRDSISFVFGDTASKRKYERKQIEHISQDTGCPVDLDPVVLLFRFEWVSDDRGKRVIGELTYRRNCNYLSPSPIVFKRLPQYAGAKFLRITLCIENHIVSMIEYPIEEMEMI